MNLDALKILSVNMQRHNKMTHVLLHDSDAHIIAIQEPWFGPVSTTLSDSDPSGSPVLGGAHNDLWLCVQPVLGRSEVAKVLVYVRQSLLSLCSPVLQLLPPLSSATRMAVDFDFGPGHSFRLINIYHQVPEKGHSLHGLLASSLDSTIPTLVVGDFNTHSPLWSPPCLTRSPWADALETWLFEQHLSCRNPTGVVTWRGLPGQTPSTLDLLFLNPLALSEDHFSDLLISFDLSLGSDHAALFTSFSFPSPLTPPPPSLLLGFHVDDDLEDSWKTAFARLPFPSSLTTPLSVHEEASALLHDIDSISVTLFARRRPPDPRGARWWNDDCSGALALWKQAPADACPHLYQALHFTIRDTKHKFASDFLDRCDSSNLWRATCWRKGRSVTRVPALSHQGTLTHHPPTMATALSVLWTDTCLLTHTIRFRTDDSFLLTPLLM
jgi:Endonuclease-reverse transcriptase